MTTSHNSRIGPRPVDGLRLVAYTRASSGRGAVSSAEQSERIRKWAEDHGHLVVAEASDLAPDAGLRSPGVGEALALVETHGADAVVVDRYSRFGRSSLDFEVNLGRLENEGVRLVSCTESADPVISHNWTLDLLALLASFEEARLADANETSVDPVVLSPH